MTRLRISIVARAGRAPSPRRRFILGSLALHVVVVGAMTWLPELGRGPRIPADAVMVELVGALPATPAATTAAPPESQPVPASPPPAEPPRGATLEPDEPEPEKKKKPVEKRPPAPPAERTPPPTETTSPATGASSPASAVAGSAAAGASVSAMAGGDASFAWYRASVTNALYNHWRRPIVSGLREPVEVRVAFEIMRDGNVRGLRTEISSGVPSLDRSALRAVGDAAPLPPLPSSLREPYLPASFVFRLYPEGY